MLEIHELEQRLVMSGTPSDAPVEAGGLASSSQVAPLSMPTAMGTYDQVAGAVPLATSLAWFDWYEQLRDARYDYSVQPRAQTFYFSALGNDATGDGSIGNPYRSLAKAREILLTTSDVALLFRRGDEFEDSVGMEVLLPKTTIGAYGDTNLAKPLFSAFTTKFNAGTNAWTQVAGTNRWTTSAPNRIGWIRDASSDAARLSPFTYLRSAQEVEANARSWYWDGTTLHFNPGVGINPNGVDYEATGDVSTHGIKLSGDGSLVADIRLDGWGAVATKGYQAYGIMAAPAFNWSVVVLNCESYYQGRHGISVGQFAPTSTGGYSLIMGCTSGYTTGTDFDTSIFNTFQAYGGNESLWENNTVRFGRLPDDRLIGGGLDDETPAFTGHNALLTNPNTDASLVINVGGRVIAENLPGSTISWGQSGFDARDLPGDLEDLSTFRHFVVDYRVLHGQPWNMAFIPKTAYINCYFDFNADLEFDPLASGNGGWFINCVWRAVDPQDSRRWVFNAATETPKVRFFNNTFLFEGISSMPYNSWLLVVEGLNDQFTYAANNVFMRIDSRPFIVGVPNDPLHLIANAYYQIQQTGIDGYNNDFYAVTLNSTSDILAAPETGSPLIGTGKRDALGYIVEYDFYRNARNPDAHTLGAVEFDWNSLPMTGAGKYYIAEAGQNLTLEATGPLPPGATYAWDINDDGIFGDAVGSNPTLTWSQLKALGLSHGSGKVRLQTTVGSTVTTSDPAYLQVIDKLPYANAGSSQIIFSVDSLTLNAGKSYAFNPDDVLEYSWDINGDGIYGDATGINPTLSAAQVAGLLLQSNQVYNARVRVWRDFDPVNYTQSAPITLTYNPSIIADAGGPYTVDEGNGVTLTAFDSGGFLTYAWDFDGDGQFDDALGRSVVYRPAESGDQVVGLRVSYLGLFSTTNVVVHSLNVPPTIGNSTAAFGRYDAAVTIYVTDTPEDSAADMFYEIDWNNDGTFDETYTGPANLVINHSFEVANNQTIKVRVTDRDGGASATKSVLVYVFPYTLGESGTEWQGTNGNDVVLFTPMSSYFVMVQEFTPSGGYINYPMPVLVGKLTVRGYTGDDYIDTSAITGTGVTIFGGAGNDTLISGGGNDVIYGDESGGEGGADYINSGSGNDTIYADGSEGSLEGTDTILGGDGDDRIFGDGAEGAADSIVGGNGNDVIDGGPANDYLEGGDGNDLIVGGDGGEGASDTLLGGQGNDVLFSDASLAAASNTGSGLDSVRGGAGEDFLVTEQVTLTGSQIEAIAAEWHSSATMTSRVAHVLGAPGGLNGDAFITANVTVFNDSQVDVVFGDENLDLIMGDSLFPFTEA